MSYNIKPPDARKQKNKEKSKRKNRSRKNKSKISYLKRKEKIGYENKV